MKFYKRDPDAALSGMADLTLQERGAYNTIIDTLYSRDGILLDDDDTLRRILGCHGNEWKAIKARLIAKTKIWIEDGYIKAKRVDSVLKEAENVSETQRIRAGKRWQIEEKRRPKKKIPEEKQGSADAKSKDAIHTHSYNHSYRQKKEERKKNQQRPSALRTDGQQLQAASEVKPNPLKEAFDVYNAAAKAVGWTQAVQLTGQREQHLRSRLTEIGGITGWREIMDRAQASPFLRGETKRGTGHENWKPDFDFFLRPATMTKLREGGYDGPTGLFADAGRRAGKERTLWLRDYAKDGRWVRNRSENGHWDDKLGIGPPPHLPDTLVTDDQLRATPGALAMVEKKRSELRP